MILAAANDPPSARSLAEGDLRRVNQDLRGQTERFALVLGDSHAVGLAAHMPCQRVSAAVGGLKAADVAEQVRRLDIRKPPAAVLLAVGTNDMLRKHRPLQSRRDWVSSLQKAVAPFRGLGARVIVLALPPIGRELDRVFEQSAVAPYSEALEEMCRADGCIYADPWTDARSDKFGQGRPEAMSDNLHLDDYRPAMKALEPLACG
ncbi:SGNH/GDSL hydrolase family protein [Bosea thiooxidans]|uniref:SGNH/GDSL hydrolase family protein n=1 Tax=Bosea thiooxidans TaxID=53254 RepID=UPI0009A6EF05|nr:SGNH/GDSL hydrolase family protein [Bosea thiooxidans]